MKKIYYIFWGYILVASIACQTSTNFLENKAYLKWKETFFDRDAQLQKLKEIELEQTTYLKDVISVDTQNMIANSTSELFIQLNLSFQLIQTEGRYELQETEPDSIVDLYIPKLNIVYRIYSIGLLATVCDVLWINKSSFIICVIEQGFGYVVCVDISKNSVITYCIDKKYYMNPPLKPYLIEVFKDRMFLFPQ